MIQLLLALFVNKFAIALRKRFVGQLRGKGASSAASVVASFPVAVADIYCDWCGRGYRPCRQNRIVPTTPLERFLFERSIGPSSIVHSMTHIEEQFKTRMLVPRLNSIRKGDLATREEQHLIAAALTNLLGEVVTAEMLFDAVASPTQMLRCEHPMMHRSRRGVLPPAKYCVVSVGNEKIHRHYCGYCVGYTSREFFLITAFEAGVPLCAWKTEVISKEELVAARRTFSALRLEAAR